MNKVLLIGRIKSIIRGDNETCVKVSVNTSIDKYDSIYVSIKGVVNQYTKEFRTNELIGVNGHLINENNKIVVVADRLTFLSSNKGVE